MQSVKYGFNQESLILSFRRSSPVPNSIEFIKKSILSLMWIHFAFINQFAWISNAVSQKRCLDEPDGLDRIPRITIVRTFNHINFAKIAGPSWRRQLTNWITSETEFCSYIRHLCINCPFEILFVILFLGSTMSFRKVIFMCLEVSLIVLAILETQARQVTVPIYSNQFAVHIPAGAEFAIHIASKHGFVNHGQVFIKYPFLL